MESFLPGSEILALLLIGAFSASQNSTTGLAIILKMI
jgi:hypothetical protein